LQTTVQKKNGGHCEWQESLQFVASTQYILAKVTVYDRRGLVFSLSLSLSLSLSHTHTHTHTHTLTLSLSLTLSHSQALELSPSFPGSTSFGLGDSRETVARVGLDVEIGIASVRARADG